MASKQYSVEMNLGDIDRFFDAAHDALEDGLQTGMNKALKLWQLQAINDAPIGRYRGRRGGNLRANIKIAPITGVGLEKTGRIVANAFNDRFNYAYYIHEVAPGKGAQARTEGTELRFLETSADKSRARMLRYLQEALEDEAKRRGLT